MVPDKFNMVDMGGIDLIMMQGEEVSGLYNRLVESIAQCRYQCLYNWLFDGVIIPPTYVEMEVGLDEEVRINEGVVITSDDVIHIYSIEPPAPEPAIIPLLAEENGTYSVPTGADGFNPVTVDVPSYTPVITSLSVTENGTYTVPEGVDGYSPVVVNVAGGVPEEYTELIRDAIFSLASKTYNNQGYYFSVPEVYETTGGNHSLLPYGSSPCSAEVYFDSEDGTGYLLGFGATNNRKMFSFTPSKFVGYSEDHDFQNSYSGKHHFVVVYDGNVTLKLYVDGSLAETITLNSVLSIGSAYFFQGRWANTNYELYTGDIYLTRVWGRALTSAEVSILYQNRDV